MATRPKDFFRYVVPHDDSAAWGISVSGGGMFRAAAGEPYPPRGHPSDHSFAWEDGRVLAAFQLILVSRGAGDFESEATGLVRLVAGSVALLFPGVSHRYRPDPATGWTEKWVEFDGTVPRALWTAGILTPAAAVVRCAAVSEIEVHLDAVHDWLRRDLDRGDPDLAVAVLSALAQVRRAPDEQREARPVAMAVKKAKRMLEEMEQGDLSLEGLARTHGVAYSTFRREFQRRTGLAPKQYHLRLRLHRAQRLLGSTDLTLKEIADRLGFSSAYHLSSAFSAYIGLPPRRWREQIRTGISSEETDGTGAEVKVGTSRRVPDGPIRGGR